jgi:hypothetical protein
VYKIVDICMLCNGNKILDHTRVIYSLIKTRRIFLFLEKKRTSHFKSPLVELLLLFIIDHILYIHCCVICQAYINVKHCDELGINKYEIHFHV